MAGLDGRGGCDSKNRAADAAADEEEVVEEMVSLDVELPKLPSSPMSQNRWPETLRVVLYYVGELVQEFLLQVKDAPNLLTPQAHAHTH